MTLHHEKEHVYESYLRPTPFSSGLIITELLLWYIIIIIIIISFVSVVIKEEPTSKTCNTNGNFESKRLYKRIKGR
jgi:hypothetical protein